MPATTAMGIDLDTDAVLDAPLHDTSGGATTLRALLGPAATVVVFLRHFG